jgi:hypothetical protein
MDDKQRKLDRAAFAKKESIRAIRVAINAIEAAGIEPEHALVGLAMLTGKIARTEGVKLDNLLTLIARSWEFAEEEPPP